MKFARFSVGTKSVVVEDAVGHIACFLNLHNKISLSDGMDATGRQEENVARMSVVFVQGFNDG